MKTNPQSFFNFCASHSPLLRELAEHGDEISETEAMRLIRANPNPSEELPETAWRRLRELQILVPTEPGSEAFFMAEPVARLLTYLFNWGQTRRPTFFIPQPSTPRVSSVIFDRCSAPCDIASAKLNYTRDCIN